MVNFWNNDVRSAEGRAEQVATDFLKRWSARKLQEDKDSESEQILDLEKTDTQKTAEQEASPQAPDKAEIPDDIEKPEQSETDEPSVASLLKEGADAAIKKAALRKLFLSGEFSEVDALNDYDHDYASVGNLAKEVSEKLRGWVKEQLEEEEKPQLTEQQDEVVPNTNDCEDIQPEDSADNMQESHPTGQNIPHGK
ncbi:DUF3306 domain-containing protein [Vibrio nigripulchritudo]|uniref:DUF3306 domain-containing protein n=1 Tax=Vibrio nigripulchritudo TaxID=28173 RepID=UPI0009B864B3|nr:DUF3306 domain-containing protein [Vibrio nigripulchritudo]